MVKHKLLLGTQYVPPRSAGAKLTAMTEKQSAPPGEPNYILVAQISLPSEDADLDLTQSANAEAASGGVGVGPPAKFQVQIRIPHDGDVNRARFNPYDELIIASRMANGQLGVFNYGRHTESPKTDECQPHLLGTAHTAEGFGLDWDPFSNGRLLTCAEDGTTRVWNVEEPLKTSIEAGAHLASKYVTTSMAPVDTFATASVSDCQWSRFLANTFGTSSLEGPVLLWDIKQGTSKPAKSFNMTKPQNSIAFAPLSEFVFATGGEDEVVNLWDVRAEKAPFHVLKGHSGEVYSISWSPQDDKMLSSCGTDRRVNVWDLERIGASQSPEDAQDGDPELLFIHAGHKATVSEMAWNPHHRFVLASVAEDNSLCVWQPAAHIFGEDDDDAAAAADAEHKDDVVEVE